MVTSPARRSDCCLAYGPPMGASRLGLAICLSKGRLRADHYRLDYQKWSDCFPRGPVGKEDCPHGTYDHIVLLLGRVVNYINRDRPRKIRVKAMRSNGYPTPPMSTDASAQSRGPVPGPGFYGMAPSAGTPNMPRAFEPAFSQPPSLPPTPEESDLEMATQQALADWHELLIVSN